MFMQFDHQYSHCRQQSPLSAPSKRETIENHVRDDTRSQACHRITAIPTHILSDPSQLRDFNRYRWRRYSNASDRAKRRNATPFDLAQIAYLALRHRRCRLLDCIAHALTLHKDYWMTRLTATND